MQSEALELAAKRLEDTYLLLQYGRASSRRVLNAQDDLFDAQNAATEAMVGYTIAMLSFYRDTGVLQVKPDGMWQTPKTVAKPAFATDNYVPTPRQAPQTGSSEETIKRWMQNQKK